MEPGGKVALAVVWNNGNESRVQPLHLHTPLAQCSLYFPREVFLSDGHCASSVSAWFPISLWPQKSHQKQRKRKQEET